MSRDDVTELLVEVLIARPFYAVSVTGWAAWTAAHFLAAPWRFLP